MRDDRELEALRTNLAKNLLPTIVVKAPRRFSAPLRHGTTHRRTNTDQTKSVEYQVAFYDKRPDEELTPLALRIRDRTECKIATRKDKHRLWYILSKIIHETSADSNIFKIRDLPIFSRHPMGDFRVEKAVTELPPCDYVWDEGYRLDNLNITGIFYKHQVPYIWVKSKDGSVCKSVRLTTFVLGVV